MTTAAAAGIRAPRVRGPARRAFIGAAAALFVLFMGNNVPSALYGLLREIFGFSSLTQTLLYAVPVVLVILPGLLVFGTLSDVAGRRTLVLARGCTSHMRTPITSPAPPPSTRRATPSGL